jgi:hypothetical protein
MGQGMMTESVNLLDEPSLQFAGGQDTIDPHDGLALFGPFSWQTPSHPQSPNYIVLGTKTGIDLFQHWAAALNLPAAHPDARKHHLWPPYPGFEVGFGSKWVEQPAWSVTVDRDQLIETSYKSDPHERCFAVVDMFIKGFQQAKMLDSSIAVAICVVPDEVWTNCRPQSRILAPSDERLSISRKKSRKAGQLELFHEFDPEQYQFSPDFRRQLKARTMEYDIQLQILRESTLRLSEKVSFGRRRLTPLSDRMWNISTALYYKCGGKPWRLNSAREGVCYVGLAFRMAEERGQSACCAAQMFLDSGDGIVFLGEDKPWYSPEDRQFHLSKEAAKKLLIGVLETYKELDGRPLTEIFLHFRSTISKEEFDGYKEACPENCKIVGVRVRMDRYGPRLFRCGQMPVLRGTFWRLSETSGYLYGAGFKPRILTYDGWETPAPLRIDVQHGDASIDMVTRDIFGLTKLNYNACRLGESQPVTIKFSDAVGEILISNPTITSHRPNFKFYI